MYYVAVYDVGVERLAKMLKLFRRYMSWIQNSVFEGELTESQYKRLVAEAEEIMDPEHDSVILFGVEDERFLEREVLGEEPGEPDRFL